MTCFANSRGTASIYAANVNERNLFLEHPEQVGVARAADALYPSTTSLANVPRLELNEMRPHQRRGELKRFIGVGATGFCIDALVLTVLLEAANPVLVSRVCSFTCASLVTWWLHRTYTFGRRQKRPQSKGGQYLRYILVQILGAAANLGVFSAVVAVVPRLLQWPVVPLAIGAVAGLVINFIGSSIWAFRARHDS